MSVPDAQIRDYVYYAKSESGSRLCIFVQAGSTSKQAEGAF